MAAEESLRKELRWVLEREIPTLLAALDVCMTQCENTVSQNMAMQPSVGTQRAILLQSSLHVDAIKGHLFVHGDRITKAEITLRLPSRGGHKVAKAFIREHDALKLEQVQDAMNHFVKAFRLHKAAMYRMTELDTPKVVSQTLGEIQQSLRESLNSLRKPKKQTVADIYTNTIRKVLKPSLPEDILLNIHIQDASIVATMILLSTVSKGQTQLTRSHDAEALGNYIGSTLELGNHLHEVVSQYQVCDAARTVICADSQVQSAIPWLSDVVEMMEKASKVCQDITEKMDVFQSVQHVQLKH